MAEAMLKRVTGRDLISARFMRKEFFEFRPSFLLMLATNAKPQFRGQDEGLWRRVKLIPWERYFAPAERDPRLTADLLAEGQGILTWAVQGAVEWYAHGLGDPPAVVNATKDYRETSNALDGFLPGEFVLDEAARGMSLSHLYEVYREWADTEGLQQREVWTKRTFSAALEERSLTKRKTNAGVVFDGLREVKPADRKVVEPRADEAPLADSSPVTPTTVGGASLDAL
jgi:putative DNA primase/helicase